MDNTSIITQVSRDEEQLSTFPPEKAGQKKLIYKWKQQYNSSNEEFNESREESSAVVVGSRDESNSSSPGKKPRGRGFLNTLLCCFGVQQRQQQQSNEIPVHRTENGQYAPKSPGKYLLPSVRHQDMHKKCMVIDLDETLVHSSFKPISNADFIVPVEIDGTVHQVYVLKRPYVDEYLRKMGELYECVLFTASLAKYADPVADLLDRWGVFRSRLFRESCVFHRGNYVKDLSRLGRELHKVVIVDNSPASYIFHPDNAVAVASWFDDMNDTELLDLIPFLEKLSKMDNVYTVLRNSNNPHTNNVLQQQQQQQQIQQQQQQQHPS